MGGFPSGQRGQTVNLLVNLSEVRILHHPLSLIRHIMCPSGGTGRRTGLKILRELNPVPVRFRSRAYFYVCVAQLDRASDYGSEGRGFESFRIHF